MHLSKCPFLLIIGITLSLLSGCIQDKNDTGLTQTKITPLQMDASVKMLPYEEVNHNTITAENRHWATVDLALTSEVIKANQASLVATCMGAAKYQAAKYQVPIVSIALYDAKGNAKVPITSMSMVAVCSYSPDGKGRNGREHWNWEQISADEQTTSSLAKQIERTWHETTEKFPIHQRANQETIAKAVGKQLNLSPDTVLAEKPILNLQPVAPTSEFENLPALPPSKNTIH